jgi:HEAT repeat protein
MSLCDGKTAWFALLLVTSTPILAVEPWQIRGLLHAALNDPYPEVQQWALRDLAAVEDWTSVGAVGPIAESIASLFDSDDRLILTRSLEAYGNLPRESMQTRHLDRIVKHLNHGEFQVRAAAARALGRSKRRESVALVLPLFNDEDETVRRAAVEATGIVNFSPGGQFDLMLLIDRFFDESPGVRRAAAEVFVSGGETITRYLDMMIHWPGERVKQAVLAAVDLLGPGTEDAILQHAILQLAREHPELETRVHAIRVAARNGWLGGRELLDMVKESESDGLRRAIMDILAATPFDDMDSSDIAPYLEDSDEQMRVSTLDIVDSKGWAKDLQSEIVSLLKEIVSLLKRRDSTSEGKQTLLIAAIDALGETDEEAQAYLPSLIDLVADPCVRDEETRRALAEAFWNNPTEAEKHFPEVLRLLEARGGCADRDDKDQYIVPAKAVEIIGENPEKARKELSRLVELLGDEHDKLGTLRSSVIRAIKASGDPNYYDKIVGFLDDNTDYYSRIQVTAIEMVSRSELFEGRLNPVLQLYISNDTAVQRAVESALEELSAPLEPEHLQLLLEPVWSDETRRNRCRFMAHKFGGGEKDSRLLLEMFWSMSELPVRMEDFKDALSLLSVLVRRDSRADRIKQSLTKMRSLVDRIEWGCNDRQELTKLKDSLKDVLKDVDEDLVPKIEETLEGLNGRWQCGARRFSAEATMDFVKDNVVWLLLGALLLFIAFIFRGKYPKIWQVIRDKVLK